MFCIWPGRIGPLFLISYRNCPLIGSFVRKLTKVLNESCEVTFSHFSHFAHKNAGRGSRLNALGKARLATLRRSILHALPAKAVLWPHEQKWRPEALIFVLGHESLSIFVRFTPNLLSVLGPTSQFLAFC